MPAGGVREQATQYFGMGSKWLRSTTSKVAPPQQRQASERRQAHSRNMSTHRNRHKKGAVAGSLQQHADGSRRASTWAL